MNSLVQGAPISVGEDPPIRTRCGQTPAESIRAFENALQQSGVQSTGRAIHFAADCICSGGISVVLKLLWNQAFCHIGVASPRIFVQLKKRVGELEELLKRLPDETAQNSQEFQVRVGEIILVLRDAPTRTLPSWPKVGSETHADGWIRSVASATETAVLRRVWNHDGDLPILRYAGAEMLQAIAQGSMERALFWIKWLFEEEAKARKELKGATLTTIDRGPATSKGRNKNDVGYQISTLLAETQKELAGKQMVRMNEEFQTLLDLQKSADARFTGSVKKQILILLVQIVCEVPRWKVPAAPPLIRDPVSVARAAGEVPKFFREVLVQDPPAQMSAAKMFKNRGKGDPKSGAKAKKAAPHEAQMAAFEKAMESQMMGR